MAHVISYCCRDIVEHIIAQQNVACQNGAIHDV